MKKKTFIVQLLDSKKPSRKSFTQVEDANFYSNDTDASLVFIPHEDTFDFQSAKVVMYNRGDESLVERDMQVTTEDDRKVASYEMPDEIISHWGDWTAQPVFISGGEIYSGSIVPFSVIRYLMHERPPRLTEVVSVTKFIQQSQALVDAMAQAEAQRKTAESSRISAESQRLSEESSRASAEAQRKIDHANRSAELAGKADKVVLRNLVVNGDFRNQLDGWDNFSNRLNAEYMDGYVRVESFLEHDRNSRLEATLTRTIESGDLIYARMVVKSNNTNVVWIADANQPIESTTVVDEISSVSTTYINTYGIPALRFRKDAVSELYSFVAINLTQTFGAGNEPTKEEMDRLIEITGYIDGEYALSNKEILDYLMNSIRENADIDEDKLINKIIANASDIKTLDEKYSRTMYRVNIFNKDNMMVGGLYNRFGEWSRSVGYLSSEFIPVEGGKTYLTSGRVGVHVLWDENKDYISGTISSSIIPTTTETKFITVAVLVEDKDNVMITLEDDMPDEYVPYDYIIPKSDRLEGRIEDMINESVSTVGNFSNKLSSNYTEPINLPVDDFSGYNQPYHPSVIYIEGGFQGYKYWLTQSPFPVGGKPRANRWEMPIVYKSHDGIDWINVADPLDDLTEQDIVDGNFFSDPHILFREDTQTLEVWYRFTDRSGGKSLTGIYRKTTTDGSTWTDREELFEPNLSYQENSIRSHSVIWDNENKVYRLWFQNEFNDGVHYRTSPDGHNWGEQEAMNLDIRHSGIWHIDVNYYNNQYHLISYSSTEQNLVYYVSDDNKNYHRQRTLLDMKDGHPLYAGGLYRSISMLDGDGKVRLYFSGDNEGNRRGINVLIADNLYEMNGVEKIDGKQLTTKEGGLSLDDLVIEINHLKNKLAGM